MCHPAYRRALQTRNAGCQPSWYDNHVYPLETRKSRYFHTWGSADANYWGTSTGSANPNSQGYIAELTYTPWGKPDSPIKDGNIRFELQYTDYTQFDGTHTHAGDNNTIFFNVGIFFDPVPYVEGVLNKSAQSKN